MISANLQPACHACDSKNVVEVDTFKRRWSLCDECGTAFPQTKPRLPLLSWLPYAEYKRRTDQTESSIYDYFTRPEHVDYSIETAREFIEHTITPHGIALDGKRVLDISGGNGHFIHEIAKLGATPTLTEINEPSLAYARDELGIDSVEFDFNRHRIHEQALGPFDIVLARAAIMFCRDLEQFVRDTASILAPGGLLVIQHSVVPTLGVLVRVQLDEYSYHVLRQPEAVIRAGTDAGLEPWLRIDETDPSEYVYDHDLNNYQLLAHYWYEIKGALRLRGHRKFAFPARDRRRSMMIFRAPAARD
ncbi:MAG: class I SAM-dependent methyltransferase [Planctomycetota bacterium]|jgi:SAM-dependent methyltransferase